MSRRLGPLLGREPAVRARKERPLHRPEDMSWPPRRILVGTDFSESANAALAAATGLARRVGAKLTLLHVAAGPSTAGRNDATLARLSALAARFAPELTELELREGDSLAELVAARDRGDFDLLVLGAGGLSGVRRFVLGSVAGKMLGYPGCPLLLVLEPPPAGEFKKILVAHENPRISLPWLELALRIAHVERAEIALLHVLPRRGYLSDSHHVELEPQRAPTRLAALLAHLDRTVPAQVIVRQGDAGHEITSAARELGVHLVVLGAERGRPDGGPGPVVNRIARAGVPAFLVVWPEPESDEDFETL